MIHLDTHAVLWLAAGDVHRFPPAAQRLLDRPWRWSPMVRLELQYLLEIDRQPLPADEVLATLERQADAREAATDWRRVVQQALPLTWPRDPFDRLIAATALADGAPLLTRDRTIRSNVSSAVWDDAASPEHQ